MVCDPSELPTVCVNGQIQTVCGNSVYPITWTASLVGECMKDTTNGASIVQKPVSETIIEGDDPSVGCFEIDCLWPTDLIDGAVGWAITVVACGKTVFCETIEIPSDLVCEEGEGATVTYAASNNTTDWSFDFQAPDTLRFTNAQDPLSAEALAFLAAIEDPACKPLTLQVTDSGGVVTSFTADSCRFDNSGTDFIGGPIGTNVGKVVSIAATCGTPPTDDNCCVCIFDLLTEAP